MDLGSRLRPLSHAPPPRVPHLGRGLAPWWCQRHVSRRGDRRLIRLVPRLPVPRRRARAGGLHGADPSAPLDPTTSGTWPMMSSTVGWTTGKPLLDRGRDEMGHVGARFVAVLASFMALAIFYAVLLVLSAAATREWDGRPSVLVTKRWPRLGGGLAVGWWLLGVLRMCQEDDE
jgi:hypothetical protein